MVTQSLIYDSWNAMGQAYHSLCCYSIFEVRAIQPRRASPKYENRVSILIFIIIIKFVTGWGMETIFYPELVRHTFAQLPPSNAILANPATSF
jgi:hypothetical protein